MKQYCEALRSFNTIHRLIGNVSCETLVNQSLMSIKSAKKELSGYDVMLDIGAGAGILGYAWLEANQGSNINKGVIFVEPDVKAQSFLRSFFGSNPRVIIIGKKLEFVTQEMIASLTNCNKKVFAASRAFSASATLESIYRRTGLPFPLYVFEKSNEQFYLTKKL